MTTNESLTIWSFLFRTRSGWEWVFLRVLLHANNRHLPVNDAPSANPQRRRATGAAAIPSPTPPVWSSAAVSTVAVRSKGDGHRAVLDLASAPVTFPL